MSKYKKGTFVIVPNLELLNGKPAVYQAIFMWLNKYADEDGICFPTRAKLATNVGSTKETVDKYIALMEEDGIITKTIRRKAGSKENTSNLYQINILDDENLPPSEIKPATPSEIKPAETISSINSITEDISATQKITLNPAQGKTPVARLQSLYGKLFNHLYGFKPKSNYAQTGAVFKSLLDSYSEIQIACLLIVFFNWRGMNDKDDNAFKWLSDNAHSPFIFKGNTAKYEAYARNVAGWGDDFDNDEKLYKVVKNKLVEVIVN